MATVSQSWPVNEAGEILLELGTGTNTKSGNLPANQVSHNPVTDKVVVKLPPESATFVAGGSNTSLGLNNNGKVTIADASLGNVRLRNNVLTTSRIGLLGTQNLTSGTFLSYLEEFTLPSDIVNIQIGVMNAHPTSSPQIRVAVGMSEVAGDPTAPLNTLVVGGVASSTINAWTNVTRNGATAISLIAMPGATVNNPFVTWFDPFPISSIPRVEVGRIKPVIKVILEFGAFQSGVATTSTITNQVADVGISGWEQDTDLTAPPYGNFWRTRSQAVAAGVDMTLINSTIVDNSGTNYHAPILVRYTLKSGKGIQVVIMGDSTNESSKDSLDKYGWLYRSLHKLSTPQLPIAICNLAQAGTTPQQWIDMANALLPDLANSIVIVPNFSPNATSPIGDTLRSASIVNAGTGGTSGTVTLTGTTGTGTPFQVTGVIGPNGNLISVGAVTVTGPYTVLPTDINNEPVTGGGLVGATLALTFVGAGLTIALQRIAKVKAVAEQYGCGVITTTCLHSNTAGKDWKGSDPILSAINAATLASNEPVMDYSAALAGNVSGSQIQFKQGMTTDGLHPNSVGHDYADINVATPLFKKLTG